MNKVYKLVWSKVRNCYVAVSEIAKNRTKAPKSGTVNRVVAAGVLACVMSCGAVMPVFAVNTDNSTYGNTETDTATGNNNVAVVSYIADVPTLPAPPSPDGGTTTATSANAVSGVNNTFIGSVGYDYNYTLTGPLAAVTGTSNIGIGNTSGRYATMITDTNFKGGGNSEQTSIEKNIYLGNVTADGSAYTSAIYGIGKTENNIILGNVYSAANSYVSLTNTQNYDSTIKGNILIGNNDGTYSNGSAIKSKNNATIYDNIAIGNTSGAALLEGQSGDYLFRDNVVLGMAKGENGSVISQKNDNVAQNMALMNMVGNRVGISDSSNAVALGSNSVTYSTGTDYPAMVEGEAAIGIGKDFHVKGDDAIVMGTESTALSDGSVSIGKRATVEGTNSIALGNESIVLEDEENVVSFGHGSSSTVKNTIEQGDITYNNELSRRLIHVAAGVNDTDAVNVSQLNEAIANLSGSGGVSYIGINSASGGANEDGSGAVGTDAIAIGKGASANDTNAIAIGVNANTKKSTGSIDSSIAIGNNAKAWADINDTETDSAISAIAIGKDAKAEGTGAVSIGYISQAKSTSGAAFGRYSKALGASSTALGSEAVANGSSDVAIGFDAKTAENKQRSTAIGSSSFFNANGSVALGSQSTASESYVVSVGHLVGDSKSNGTAYEDTLKRRIVSVEDGTASHNAATVGQTIELVAGDNVTIAPDTTATNSIGQKRYKISAVSSDGGSTPYIGINSASGGANEDGSGAVGTDSIAIGRGAEAKDVRAVAIGMEASTGEPNPTNNDISIAIGWKAKASGQPEGDTDTNREYSSIAIGVKADAENRYSVAVGDHSVATGESSVSIGRSTEATKINGVAIGSYAVANGAYSIAEGRLATTYGFDSIAIGSYAKAGEENVTTKSHQVAIGSDSKADGDNAVALGYNTKVNGKNSVALGSSSIATEDSVISVGSSTAKRRIVNVADGTSATEAATVGQTIELIDGTNTKIISDGQNSIGQNKYKVNVTSDGEILSGNTGLVTGGAVYDAIQAIDIPEGAVYTAGNGLRLEDNKFSVETDGAIATSNTGVLNGGTVYNEVRPDQNGIFVKSANTVGQNLLVLDSELSGIKTRMDDAVIYDGANHAKATLTGGTAGTTLDNVKAGLVSKNSKEAVNGGQLWSVKEDIKGFAQDIERNTNSIQTLNSSVSNALASVAAANTLVNTVNDLKADASLNNLSAAGKQVISNAAIDAVQQYMASQEADANTSSLNTSNRTMKTNKRVDGLSLSLMASPGADANYVVYDDAEASQITLEDASGEGTKVTNVAEGSLSAASTDAVNGSQLYKTNQNVAALQDTISLNNGTIASLQTDSQKVKTDMLTLQSQYATTKNQVETGFNVTVNGAKVKTVDPDSAYIDFVAGDGIDITADNGSVKISNSVQANGQVVSGDTNAVSGDTVYQEVRPAVDGNYIKSADTTSANLTSLDTALNTEVSERSSAVTALQEADAALSNRIGVLSEDGDYVRKDASVSANLYSLDEALYDKADYDAANIGKNYDGSSSEKEFNARQWGEALGTGNIEGGDSRLVTGDTVNVEVRPAYDGNYVKVNSSVGNNLLSLDEHVLANREDIDSHAEAISDLKDLSNLSDSGKEVVKELAADAVDVTGSDTVTVEKSTVDGVNYFKVSAKTDGLVAYNNNGVVTGGKLFEELRPVEDGSFVEGRNTVAANLTVLDAQIKANKDAIAELAGAPSVDLSDMVRYDSSEHSKVTLDGSSVGTTLTNVRSGVISKTSKDAVNGSQLWAVKQDIEGFAEDIRRNSNNIQTLNGSVSNALSSVAAANTLVNTVNDLKADASLNNLSAAGKQVIANAAMDAVQQYMANKSSVDPSANLNSNYYTINVADLIDDFSGNDNLGDFKQNRNDLLLTTSLRKVNPSGAADDSGEVVNYVVYDDADSSAITLEGADGTKVSNVADGMLSADSKDAVNGKQLFETNTRVDTLGSKLDAVSGDVDSLRTDIEGLQDGMDGIRTGLSGLQTDVDAKADNSLSNISDEGKDVVRGLAKKSLQVSSGKYVTVDKQDVDGIDNYRINVVADGEVADGNDGIVTGGKVFEALSHIDVSDERIRNVVKEDLAEKADKNLSNLSDNGKDVIRDVVKPDLDKKADVNASNIDVAAWSDKLGVGNVAEGDNGLVKGGAVYEAIKDIRSSDMMAVDEYSIRLGGNAKYDAYDVVDVSKSDGSGRVMTGIVVNPDDPNSAVNVGYVDAVGQNIINGVNDGLRKVDDKINKVGAGAAAMASLAPLPFDDDQKWNVSAAVGTYKGEQSGAVGVFFKPQDNVMLNLRGSFGNGENMGGAGVTVGLNKGVAHGLSKVAMAKAMNAQAVEIANQKQLIVNQQEQLDVARAEIEELKALVNNVVSANADKG